MITNVNFTPKTDIEEYLNTSFNYIVFGELEPEGEDLADRYNLSVYEDLTESEEWKGIFEPVEFLNLFYKQLKIVEANKAKPTLLIKHLLGLGLDKKQLRYLLYALKNNVSNFFWHGLNALETNQIRICGNFINLEYEKLSKVLNPQFVPEIRYMPNVKPEPIKVNATLNHEALQSIFDILKDFFDKSEQPEFKRLLETFEPAKNKLTFKDNGNKLTDTFRQLIDNNFITGCKKTELIQWIVSNFNYLHNGNVKEYTYKTAEQIISGTQVPCQSPIIEIKNGVIQRKITK